MADKTPVAKVVERKFPHLSHGAFPSTSDTVKLPETAKDEPEGNVTPLSWWRRMVGKKAG